MRSSNQYGFNALVMNRKTIDAHSDPEIFAILGAPIDGVIDVSAAGFIDPVTEVLTLNPDPS